MGDSTAQGGPGKSAHNVSPFSLPSSQLPARAVRAAEGITHFIAPQYGHSRTQAGPGGAGQNVSPFSLPSSQLPARAVRAAPGIPALGCGLARRRGKSWLEGKDKGGTPRAEPRGPNRSRTEGTDPPARALAIVACTRFRAHPLSQGGRRNEGYPRFRIQELCLGHLLVSAPSQSAPSKSAAVAVVAVPKCI